MSAYRSNEILVECATSDGALREDKSRHSPFDHPRDLRARFKCSAQHVEAQVICTGALADIAPPGLELPPDGKLLTGLLRASMNDPEFSDQLPLIVVEEGIEITELTADNSSKELL